MIVMKVYYLAVQKDILKVEWWGAYLVVCLAARMAVLKADSLVVLKECGLVCWKAVQMAVCSVCNLVADSVVTMALMWGQYLEERWVEQWGAHLADDLVVMLAIHLAEMLDSVLVARKVDRRAAKSGVKLVVYLVGSTVASLVDLLVVY